jgi:RTX calcium-binding nonapeptide repeat (4 copies)
VNIHLPTSSGRSPRRRLAATVATLGLAALAFPAGSLAHQNTVDGVSASVEHGTLEVRGSSHADSLALRLKAGDPNTVQVDVGDDGSADFSFPRSPLSAIAVKAGAGNDTVRIDDSNGSVDASNGTFPAIPTTIAGGPGDDKLIGGAGAETLKGGAGNDSVIGGKGNDTADLGEGNDTFGWSPGDGSDTIEGQRGTDTMLFDGAPAAENVTMSADRGHLKFVRDVGNVTMDTHGVERVDFNALGGSDHVTVNDLTGTDVTNVNLDLARTLDGSTGDIENIAVNGTNGDDTINVAGNGSGADVTGLAAAVSIVHANPADTLTLNSLAGKDSVSATGVFGMQVSINPPLR